MIPRSGTEAMASRLVIDRGIRLVDQRLTQRIKRHRNFIAFRCQGRWGLGVPVTRQKYQKTGPAIYTGAGGQKSRSILDAYRQKSEDYLSVNQSLQIKRVNAGKQIELGDS